MLGHGDMGKLSYICHIPVADNIHRVIDMVNTILMLDNIQSKGAELLLFNAVDHVAHIHQRSSGAIDQHHAVLHFRNAFPVDHVVSALQQRCVQRYDITFCVKSIQLHIFCHVSDRAIWISVICKDSTAESLQNLNNRSADTPGPHNSNSHVSELTALQPIQGVIIDVSPEHGLLIFSQRHEHQHNGILRHSGRRIADIADPDTQFPGILQINMIIAHCAGTVKTDTRVPHKV